MLWQIEWMKTLTETIPGYVVECGWRCTGKFADTQASVYGTCSFAVPANTDGTFAPYSSLTEEQVLSWCWASGVDKDATEAAVKTQLDALINPVTTTPPLPWAKD